MNYLKDKNSHERDQCIQFTEKTHTYSLTNKKNRLPFTSVTTWIHHQFPKFNADVVIEKMMKSPKWPQNKYYGKSKYEIKTEWKNNGIQAATMGTKMHYDIECFYNKVPVENTSMEYSYFQNFENERDEAMIPYRTEWNVYDEELLIAGSIDMIFEKDGKLKLYDWKRCKEIRKTNMFEHANNACIDHLPNANFWHYTLQLNIYKYILEKHYGKEVDELCLVCLHPDNANKNYIKIKVPILYDEIEDLMTYRKNELV